MVFKRRDPKPVLRAVAEFIWPRGGWGRAFHYVRHRLRRLPDSPERIARGIWAGVFTAFTPFYGLHFVIAALLARFMRGNILASLMGTFFGNPLTYVPIGLAALETGHWLMGSGMKHGELAAFGGKFWNAIGDVWGNLMAMLGGGEAHWGGVYVFYAEVFYPYLIGGVLPGIFCATICYLISAPLIRAYQQRRRGVLKAKFEALKAKAAAKAEAKRAAEE